MVAVSPPAKVLVTGANGYLATWVLKKYLEAGYSVRGTVRSLSKGAFLKDKFAHYGDRFELVVVEDITRDGAFDEVVKDVDAIAHTASPFHYKSTNPDGMSDFLWILILFGAQDTAYIELIIPAVQGTTSILNSALKHGNFLKRFILTSSVAAIREDKDTTVPRVFTESNWNDLAVEAVKTKGSTVGPFTIYPASKTLAEKAAWEFVAAHSSEISWDLVVINPPWIFGASPFFASFSLTAEFSTHTYSLRSAPRRQLMTSIPLSVQYMTPYPVRGQVRNYEVRETGSMWLSPQRHMYAPHMQ
jgi:nucleoside-diphosphate-sugar epimerase